ncbi:MAG: hypothetical protein AB1637_02340 [Elusimicrobiota bacterium]
MRKIITIICFCSILYAGENKMSDFAEFTCDGKYFSIKYPAKWGKSENITTGRVYKEYGAVFQGPEKEGFFAYLSFTYYGKDHGRFDSYQKYLKLNAYPDKDLPIAGEKYYTVKKIKLNGVQAFDFTQDTFKYVPPDGVNPKKVSIRVRKILIPSQGGGFFVLELNTPISSYTENNIIFEKSVKTFKALI